MKKDKESLNQGRFLSHILIASKKIKRGHQQREPGSTHDCPSIPRGEDGGNEKKIFSLAQNRSTQ
jgi:hypothetical protein